MRYLHGAVVAAVMALATAPAAQALDLGSDGLGLPCWELGNDNETDVEAAILAATGSALDLSLYGKSDDNPGLFGFTGLGTKNGTWDVLDNSIQIAFVTVKASNRWSIFDVGGANSGDWTTLGLINNGGQQPNLSHLSFWTTGPAGGTVPEPAAWAMMLAGFGLVGLASRRRRRTAHA